MMKKVVYHGESTVRALCDNGAISTIRIREGTGCEFYLVFESPEAEVRLSKKRTQGGQVQERSFKDLTRAAQMVKSMGFSTFICEMSPVAHRPQAVLEL